MAALLQSRGEPDYPGFSAAEGPLLKHEGVDRETMSGIKGDIHKLPREPIPITLGWNISYSAKAAFNPRRQILSRHRR